MPRLTLPLAGGGQVSIDTPDDKDAFRQASFWQSLPGECPVDGMPTRLMHRNPGDYDYYSVVSTGPVPYEFKLGQHKEGGTLFPKDQWTYYDPDAVGNDGKKGVEIVVWERGRLFEDRIPSGAVRQTTPRQRENALGGPGEPAGAGGSSQASAQGGGGQTGGGQASGDEKRLADGLSWVNRQLNAAGVPDMLKTAVLTNMLSAPVPSVTRLTWDQVRELVEMQKADPDTFKVAREKVEATEAEGQGEFPPEDDLPF